MANNTGNIDATEFPYLSLVDKLKFSYPALGSFVRNLRNRDENGRQLVQQYSLSEYGRLPGRCCVLEFRTNPNRSWVHKVDLSDYSNLQTYLETHNRTSGEAVQDDCNHRLYVLEDLTPEYIGLLGQHLMVDPLVLASHTNNWKFQQGGSIAQRTLPSLNNARKSFTVRYPELRSSKYGEGLKSEAWTCAANRRKIDPWFPIDGGPVQTKEDIGIVRRCVSFWADLPGKQTSSDAWNALLLVDPPINMYGTSPATGKQTENYRILVKDKDDGRTIATTHSSKPFRFGHPDPIPIEKALGFTAAHSGTGKPVWRKKQSLFDETILYWTQKGNQQKIKAAIKEPCNTMYYTLKVAAYHWTSLLDIIHLTLNQGEFVAGKARAPPDLFTQNSKIWKDKLLSFYDSIWFLNIFRRRLGFYEDDLDQILERLNPRDVPTTHEDLPLAIQDATLDFKALLTRLRLYKSRVEALASLSDEIINMRQAAKGLEDGAFNLRLAIFAAVVFPGTFIAAIFSMAEGYRPGDGQFWIYWVVSVPLILVMVMMIAGRGKWVNDVWKGGLRWRISKGKHGKDV